MKLNKNVSWKLYKKLNKKLHKKLFFRNIVYTSKVKKDNIFFAIKGKN